MTTVHLFVRLRQKKRNNATNMTLVKIRMLIVIVIYVHQVIQHVLKQTLSKHAKKKRTNLFVK